MSIEVEEKNDGITCVTWKTLKSLIISSREINETFELKTPTNLSFYVSFTHDLMFNFLNFDTVCIELKLGLSLFKDLKTFFGDCGDKAEVTIKDHQSLLDSTDALLMFLSDSPDLPCSIWVTINDEDRRINLERPYGSDEWTSGRFGIRTFGNPTFHLWLQFKTNNKETNKVRKLADAQQTLSADDEDNITFPKESCDGEKIVLEQLEKVFVQQTNCDVQFLFDEDEKIGAHVSMLSARSPVFSNMFHHNLQDSQTDTIFVQDIRPQIFKEMLHYLYTGRTLAPLTDVTAQPLFVAANKYDIEDLKEKCVCYLLRTIRKSNAIDLLVWADLHSMEKIKEAALDFVARNFKTICQSNEWENLVKNYPELGFLATRRYATV